MKYAGQEIAPGGLQSPPSRGAWIEITAFLHKLVSKLVAPLAGGVD